MFFGLPFNFFSTKMNLLILQNLSSIQYEKKKKAYQRFQLYTWQITTTDINYPHVRHGKKQKHVSKWFILENYFS